MNLERTATRLATIVVVPRERFSYSKASLESIYQLTDPGFELVYVDGKSPLSVRRYLEREAKKRGFRLVRTERYLSPNEARNIGLAEVRTKYVVFVDNDVLVRKGWLRRLIECAEATDAWVVGPLYLEGQPGAETIHMAGGDVQIQEKGGRQVLSIHMRNMGKRVEELEEPLQREKVDNIEFHCVLVQTEVFNRTGPLDEKLLTTREHVDFCLSVFELGGSVYLEPASVISYVPPFPMHWSDLPYYLFRWSGKRTDATVLHFQEKWKVHLEGYRSDIIRGRRRRAMMHVATKPLQKVKSWLHV